jgi:hypothetical protein
VFFVLLLFEEARLDIPTALMIHRFQGALPGTVICRTTAATSMRTGVCARPAGPARNLPGYALTSAGFQMLILRVSGITKIAMMKHTAGTKIG